MASPTLTVLLDDGSGTFPFDISAYVLATESYDITRGRDDWQGAVTTGELSLTLNNSDGRFTPGSTILASPSPIKVDQRIQVRETFPGGGGFGMGGFGVGGFGLGSSTFIRFTGYVKAWPVSWPATVPTFSTVRITAVDAQARAERRTLRSSLEEAVLADSPAAYYTLSENTGATSAGDTSGNQATPLTITGTGAALTFGTGTGPIGGDSLPAAQFFGGKYLKTTIPFSSTNWDLFLELVVPAVPAAQQAVSYTPAGDQVTVDTSGRVCFTDAFSTVYVGPSVVDGTSHAVEIQVSGGSASYYVDGALVATGFGGPGLTAGNTLYLGGAPAGTSLAAFVGTMSHVALFNTALGSTRAAAHYTAGGGTVEAGTSRLARLAGYAGVTVGTMDASLTNVSAAVGWSGTSAQDQLQAVADAEFGLVFIDGTGALTFHNRNRVVSKTAPDLILSSQYVTPDVNPVVDDQRIVNYMEVTAAGTGGTTVVQGAAGAASETAHGRYPTSQSYLVRTDAEAVDRGNWIVANFAEPGATPRYGTLTINLFGMTDSMAASVLAALDLDCWLRVTSAPSQNPGGSTVDVIVQGWSASRTAESWAITCNVVPHSLFAPVWVLDTSHLDTNTRLYV